jgi:DNA-binding Lrp family transcriptional regulator
MRNLHGNGVCSDTSWNWNAHGFFGRYDLVAHVETSGLDALPYVTDKIRAIEGVLSTESLIIHS